MVQSKDRRSLEDLVSVGPAAVEDFRVLGIEEVSQLIASDPLELYRSLCQVTGIQHDICVLDVFTAAVAQAKNPDLPREMCDWWYWSHQRKSVEE